MDDQLTFGDRADRQSPQARVFRAFNALGWENFAEPVIGGVQADLIYCGADDQQAREAVEKLIEHICHSPEGFSNHPFPELDVRRSSTLSKTSAQPPNDTSSPLGFAKVARCFSTGRVRCRSDADGRRD